MTEYDVIIIGAGAGRGTLARHLARGENAFSSRSPSSPAQRTARKRKIITPEIDTIAREEVRLAPLTTRLSL